MPIFSQLHRIGKLNFCRRGGNRSIGLCLYWHRLRPAIVTLAIGKKKIATNKSLFSQIFDRCNEIHCMYTNGSEQFQLALADLPHTEIHDNKNHT